MRLHFRQLRTVHTMDIAHTKFAQIERNMCDINTMIIVIIVVVVCGRYCCTSRLNHLISLAYACKNILLILPIIQTVITSRDTHTQYAWYRVQEEKKMNSVDS